MTVFRVAAIVAGAVVALSFTALPQTRAAETAAMRSHDADLSSQQRRVRPRVRVYRTPQPPFWEYPRPGVYSWPGPNAKRDCRAWYVVENRPSGAVMTPRMRCEWVPG